MDLAMNIGYALVKEVEKLDQSIFILTKPDTLINLQMHEPQIDKFKKSPNVFMVLNRDGGDTDDKMTIDEWNDKEGQFFANMAKTYPMYNAYKNKLGIETLIKQLSYRLSQCIMDTTKYTSEIIKRRDLENKKCKLLTKRLRSSNQTLMQLLTNFQGRATDICLGAFNTYSYEDLPSDVHTESLTYKIKEIMSDKVAEFLGEEVNEQVEERTTDQYLQKKNLYGTDTNKDTMWNQVARHVIQEIFIHIKNVFVGDETGINYLV